MYAFNEPKGKHKLLLIMAVNMTITTSLQNIDLGSGNFANVETYNGGIPGPTLELQTGEEIIVRLVNNLPYPTGIHWHGIELYNSADGTPITQDPAVAGIIQILGNGVAAGGTHLYKFKAPRPGIYWYHPHHFHSTNRVFRGLYGMIIVTDPVETALISGNHIPGPADTLQLVLSDITVCKAPTMNDTATYVDPSTILPVSDRPEWLSGATAQLGPSPADLCELFPLNEDGSSGLAFGDQDIPNIQRSTLSPVTPHHPAGGLGRTNEGQTVLVNGAMVAPRTGTPASNPQGTIGAGPPPTNVQPGQWLRLQLVNCAHLRYFRLRLTGLVGGTVQQIPIIRIGGEGGLLENAIEEGYDGTPGIFDSKYETGEILLPPATRADVVVSIPNNASGILTMWTRDYQRAGNNNPGNWAQLPTVPILHLNVTGATIVPAQEILAGDPILAAVGASVTPLGTPVVNPYLDSFSFVPFKDGMGPGVPDIELNSGGGPKINNVTGSFMGSPYTSVPHLLSTRYVRNGDILQLTVNNKTNSHHPFHLHGFSFQPISLVPNFGGPSYSWTYTEFRDTIDIPAQHTLTFKVHISDRELADGTTFAGAFGRWMFHCHLFFHAHGGMISEMVVTDPDGTGSEKPNVDVNGSWAYAPAGGTATRTGNFGHPDGDPVTLTTSHGNFTSIGGGKWSWEFDSLAEGVSSLTDYVYITATDSSGRMDQAVFRLKIGTPDDGSDNGDPHIHTVDGNRYDFQAVGEFILLRDRDGMEIQTRQTPVLTANPITDPHTGLTTCVSLNTAVAARVGKHRIALQPGGDEGELMFFVDGKRMRLTNEGFDLDGNRVSGLDVNGNMGLRIDYLHHPVLIVSPHFWPSHQLWYLNISVSHTQADEGIMGAIPEGSWLPKLSSGASVGVKPQDLVERYNTLYKTFADSWRVSHKTSLFVYSQGTSTTTFTDKDWPAIEVPCDLKPQFEIPGVTILEGMPLEKAETICRLVTDDGLKRDCIFDVATTGDKFFAEEYLIAQELKQKGTKVQLKEGEKSTLYGDVQILIATVLPIYQKQLTPKGYVTFYNNNKKGPSIELDEKGRAVYTIHQLKSGEYNFHAIYQNDEKTKYRPSRSPSLKVFVEKNDSVEKVKKYVKRLKFICVLLLLLLILIISLN